MVNGILHGGGGVTDPLPVIVIYTSLGFLQGHSLNISCTLV